MGRVAPYNPAAQDIVASSARVAMGADTSSAKTAVLPEASAAAQVRHRAIGRERRKAWAVGRPPARRAALGTSRDLDAPETSTRATDHSGAR